MKLMREELLLQVLFSAPASFHAILIERVFAAIKKKFTSLYLEEVEQERSASSKREIVIKVLDESIQKTSATTVAKVSLLQLEGLVTFRREEPM